MLPLESIHAEWSLIGRVLERFPVGARKVIAGSMWIVLAVALGFVVFALVDLWQSGA